MTGRRVRAERAEALIIDPTLGLSGDMLLASLIDLGAPRERIAKDVAKLRGLEPFRISVGRVKRHGIEAAQVRVRAPRAAKERSLGAILAMIDRSTLDGRVKELAARTFALLGKAEGKIHGVPAAEVHFHEVGAVDSIVDIVGVAAALALLGFPRLYHRPLRLGSGVVSTAHGELPIPAPATIEVIRGRRASFGPGVGEVATPTGAALVRSLAEELPADAIFTPRRIVYAAGTRDDAHGGGMLRVIEAVETPREREVAVLRTTIDDMNPQIYGHLQQLLFSEGALEVYLTQLIMKKGRPGVLVTVICDPPAIDRLLMIIFRETTTLGVRLSREERVELERWTEDVETPIGAIRIKRGRLPDGSVKSSPEYESCREAAARTGLPLQRVAEAAREAASSSPVRAKRAARRKGTRAPRRGARRR